MLLLTLKLLHVFAVTIFFGNIITGLFWKAHADRTRIPNVQAHALEGIIRSDQLFTIPSVLAIVATGLALAVISELPLLQTAWISGSVAAFSISGVLFAAWIAPLQKRLLRIAKSASDQAEWPSRTYRTTSHQWEIIGAIAILLPLGALALMIFKPL